MTCKGWLKSIVGALVLGLLVCSVQAAEITWNETYDTVRPDDVITNGDLHEAVNGSSVAGSVVVNVVTFSAIASELFFSPGT